MQARKRDETTAPQTPESNSVGPRGSLALPALFWAIFAVLLAFTISRHEMWSDELQAFLIARDSNSLAELFRNLRYEGHPALWYLLLLIPAHISWNPVGMQILNYLLALTEASLILSVRDLKLIVRVLLVFSFTVFYTDGALARSYMLALLLLTAALCCYSSKRSISYLTILFIALAINTHLFAIPIALLLAAWMFFPELSKNLGDWLRKICTRERILLTLVLVTSTVIASLTLRPPVDEFLPHYGRIEYSLGHNLLVSLSGLWAGIFVPMPLIHHFGLLAQALPTKDHAPILATILSLLCLLLATLTLRTLRARAFYLVACMAEILAFALTVHLPDLRHYGMLFVIFILALLMDARSATLPNARFRLKPAVASSLLIALLALQAVYGVYAAAVDWSRSYSNAHDAALWLRESHLAQTPIVIVGASGPSIVGYLERNSVFYAACDCEGSFYKYARGWDYERTVTADELQQIHGRYQQPVTIISNNKFSDAETLSLQIHEIKEFSGEVLSGSERYFIYEQNAR